MKNTHEPIITKELYDKAHNDRNTEGKKELDIESRKITFKISKLYNDRLNEEIGEDEYKEQYSKLLEERKRYDAEKADTSLEILKFQNQNDYIQKTKNLKKIIKALASEDLTHEDVENLITKIEIGKGYLYIFYKFEDINNQEVSCCD